MTMNASIYSYVVFTYSTCYPPLLATCSGIKSKPYMLNFGYLLNARVLDRTRHHIGHWGDIMRHDDLPGCARIQDISNTQFRWTMVIAKGKLFLEVSICHFHACVRFLEGSSGVQLLFSVFVSLRFHSQRSKCSECASFARMIVDRPWIKGPNGIRLSYSAMSIWCLYDFGAAKTKSAAWRNFMADCIKKQTQTCSGLLGKPIHKCTPGNSRVLHRCLLSQPTWWDRCCPSEQPPPVWCSWTCTWTGPVSRHMIVHLVVEEEHRRQKVQKKEHKILACVQTPPVVRTAASYWYTHLL